MMSHQEIQVWLSHHRKVYPQAAHSESTGQTPGRADRQEGLGMAKHRPGISERLPVLKNGKLDFFEATLLLKTTRNAEYNKHFSNSHKELTS